MHRQLTRILSAVFVLSIFITFASAAVIRPGQIWPDTSGQHINAHCGDIIEYDGIYYWFGENRGGNRQQVNCYASTNLQDWTFRNIVLKDLGKESGFTERPKVIYNDRTKKFVMWMHKEGAGSYREARAAVAVSDAIDGDYRFLGSFRPSNNMSRDCYLFKDDDGAAYFVSSSNDNADMKVYRLTDDYLKIDHLVITLFKGQYREAPVLFKRNGFYYLLTSFCTGTKPNPQYYSTAKSLNGPWSKNRPLCAKRTWNTYYAQGACEFTVQGSKGATCVYDLDRWVKPMRHVWLPLEFNADGTIKPLEWHDEWQIDAETGLAVIPPATTPVADNLAKGRPVNATYNSPGEMFGFSHFANHEPALAVDGHTNTFWSPKDNLPHWLKVDLLKPTDISGVKFTYWKAGANTYRVEVSKDGVKWKSVIQNNSSSASRTVKEGFFERRIRYVRVWLLESDSGYNWPGITELTVFAKGNDIAKNKPVIADDFQARSDSNKAVDGDFSTAWTIDDDQLPQSITLDLGAASNLGGVRILWETPGVAYRYCIETSSDKTTWKTVVNQTGNPLVDSQPDHRFRADARYVRVTLIDYDHLGGDPKSSMHPWPGIREIEVFK